METFDDLAAEQDRLESILGGLGDHDWRSPSAAPGWTVSDVVLHLAQSDEAVVASVAGVSLRDSRPAVGDNLDEVMHNLVVRQRTTPAATFGRWQAARRAALDALRAADPDQRCPWAAAPLKPRTLATTRLAEHWAHGLDITTPLGIELADTDRLRHVAWLGHGSLPYALTLAGQPVADVRVELSAPDGTDVWSFGATDAESTIKGPAGDFCRVGARRLRPEDSGLRASGPHGATALRVLRNYAT